MGNSIYQINHNGINNPKNGALPGNLDLCKVLVDKHIFDVHMVDKDGWKIPHYSARYGNYEVFRYFANVEADIYLKNHNGLNCLHIAAMYGHLGLCKILIDKHNFEIQMADNDGWTVLHYSVRYGSYELFRHFAEKTADIYLKSHNGWNCLHIAALHGHLTLCKMLIDKHNFGVHMADNDGRTALHFSARYGSYELFRYFFEIGADIYQKDHEGSNCLHIPALHGNLNLCKILVDKHNFNVHVVSKDGCATLHYSARYGSYEMFRYFADMGADIYLKSHKGWNCLHIAAMYGHLGLCKTLKNKHNFKIQMFDNYGWTALHYSARYESYDVSRYFAGMGADIYLKTVNGWNCLHIAALCGHLNLCQILIDKHNFEVHMADNDRWTALHFSARYGSYELFRYFAGMGADIYLKTVNGWNCLHIAALHGHLNLCKILIDKHNFEVHMADNDGWTALHFSARYGSYELFRYIVQTGADIYLKSRRGSNCFHIAAWYGHLNLCKILQDKHNFNVHMADDDGWTAFHFSARYGSYELIRYFADIRTDIYLKNNDGCNCLHIAARYGHLNLCNILKDKHKFDIHMVVNDGETAVHYSAEKGSYELIRNFFDMGADIYHYKIMKV